MSEQLLIVLVAICSISLISMIVLMLRRQALLICAEK